MVITLNNEVATFITVIGEMRNNSGFVTGENTEETQLFVSVKSVGRTEYYKALSEGIEAKIIFSVNPDDYDLTKRVITVNGTKKKVYAGKLVYDDETYRIIRAYKKNLSEMELTCEVVQ